MPNDRCYTRAEIAQMLVGEENGGHTTWQAEDHFTHCPQCKANRSRLRHDLEEDIAAATVHLEQQVLEARRGAIGAFLKKNGGAS